MWRLMEQFTISEWMKAAERQEFAKDGDVTGMLSEMHGWEGWEGSRNGE